MIRLKNFPGVKQFDHISEIYQIDHSTFQQKCTSRSDLLIPLAFHMLNGQCIKKKKIIKIHGSKIGETETMVGCWMLLLKWAVASRFKAERK